MVEKRQELEGLLAELRKIGDVEASAIIRRDGLMIASDMPSYVDGRTIAAMTAALIGAGETTIGELKLGEFGQAIVDSEKGKLVAMGAGSQAVLACLVGKDANLGLILVNMEKSSKRIAELLSG